MFYLKVVYCLNFEHHSSLTMIWTLANGGYLLAQKLVSFGALPPAYVWF